QATRLVVSSVRQASRMASEIWSALLSGWPSVTDSEVNKERFFDAKLCISFVACIDFQLRALIARLALIETLDFDSSGTCDDARGAGETPTRQPAILRCRSGQGCRRYAIGKALEKG